MLVWHYVLIILGVSIIYYFLLINRAFGKFIERRILIRKLLREYEERQSIAFVDPVNGSTETLEEMYDIVMEAIEVRKWFIRRGVMTEMVGKIMYEHEERRKKVNIMELDWSKLHHLRCNLEKELDLRYQIQEGRDLEEIKYGEEFLAALMKKRKENGNNIQAT